MISVGDGEPIPVEGFGSGGVSVSEGYQTPIASSEFDLEFSMDIDASDRSEDFFENDEVPFRMTSAKISRKELTGTGLARQISGNSG